MSESSSTPSQTSGSALHEGKDEHDLTAGLDLGFDGAEDVLRAWRRGMRPDADLTVSEWADAHRWLSSRASAEPGRYRTARTPYGPVAYLCRSECSFKPPSVRKRPDFSIPMLSADAGGYRTR